MSPRPLLSRVWSALRRSLRLTWPRPSALYTSAALLFLVSLGLLIAKAAGGPASGSGLVQNAFFGSDVPTDTPQLTETPAPTATETPAPAPTDTPIPPTPTPAPVSTITFGCLSVTPHVPADGTYVLRTCVSASPMLPGDQVNWEIQFCPGTAPAVTVTTGNRFDSNGQQIPTSQNDPNYRGTFTVACAEPFQVTLTALTTTAAPDFDPSTARPVSGTATVTAP